VRHLAELQFVVSEPRSKKTHFAFQGAKSNAVVDAIFECHEAIIDAKEEPALHGRRNPQRSIARQRSVDCVPGALCWLRSVAALCPVSAALFPSRGRPGAGLENAGNVHPGPAGRSVAPPVCAGRQTGWTVGAAQPRRQASAVVPATRAVGWHPTPGAARVRARRGWCGANVAGGLVPGIPRSCDISERPRRARAGADG